VIALLAGDLGSGPIPLALAHAGFEVRQISTSDEADCELAAHGAGGCVLVVGATSLGSRAGSPTWARFLSRRAALPAVVVGRGALDVEVRSLAAPPHRILLEDPFDAAAVAAAALRASAIRRPPMRRSRQRWSEAG
jgi:hypothetical protein